MLNIQHTPTPSIWQPPTHLGSTLPYYFITIDFMLTLPPGYEGKDCALLVVYKFSKELIIVAGNKRWIVQ